MSRYLIRLMKLSVLLPVAETVSLVSFPVLSTADFHI